MAEGLLRERSHGQLEVDSAGTNPKGVNPLSVQVMKEIAIDISAQQSKDVSIFWNKKFDWVITVCDRAKENCPVFPGARVLHWSTPDPEDLESFRNVRDQLAARIDSFLATNP